MTQTSFLPEWYIKRRAKQGRLIWEACFCLLIVGVMAGWFVTAKGNTAKMREDAVTAESQASSDPAQGEQIRKLEIERAQLVTNIQLYRQLAAPIRVSTVLATIAELAPADVALQSMTIGASRVQPAGRVEDGSATRRVAKRAKSKTSQADEPGWKWMRIEFDGVAPDDRDIADFVARLDDHPIFEDVQLRHSRAGELQGFEARTFRVDLRVPLNRLYRPVAEADSAKRQEVAHVD